LIINEQLIYEIYYGGHGVRKGFKELINNDLDFVDLGFDLNNNSIFIGCEIDDMEDLDIEIIGEIKKNYIIFKSNFNNKTLILKTDGTLIY
jgi:hypothetical protein